MLCLHFFTSIKLPALIIHACLKITDKKNSVEKIGLCLFAWIASHLTAVLEDQAGFSLKTWLKRYNYFKIKPPKALFVEVHTMFTHMHIKMQLMWIPPFNELPAKLYKCTCKTHFGSVT